MRVGGVRGGGSGDRDDALAEARVPLLASSYTSSVPGRSFF